MGKGSGRRPKNISDAELEKAWNSIFSGHPNDGQFDKEDDYGNELPTEFGICNYNCKHCS